MPIFAWRAAVLAKSSSATFPQTSSMSPRKAMTFREKKVATTRPESVTRRVP